MGAIPERASVNKKSTSSKKSFILIGAILGGIALVGLGYMFVFVEPELVEERVKVIAVTETGCVGETFDGYAVNIGQCYAQPGDIIMTPVDQKLKERAYAMNPTD
jgi:flagellar basal body-associated protein FliL